MIARLYRLMARWHHRGHIADIDWQLRVHRAHLAGLPAEIERLEQLQRAHRGRLATLQEKRSPVNYRLAGLVRRPR